ncbi:MAG: histidinol dehydrogenase [Deltaproteobacteria bacterium]|nr:histidinol dehydrogenase [Candidatus Anaeroferrophillus wilburensis]MBN2888642.1 histidinol dehydrogenase [Deltaproteobacteria bacterium]
MTTVTVFESSAAAFQPFFQQLCERNPELTREAEQTVGEIIDRVRREGDAALFDYTKKFDGLDLGVLPAEVSPAEMDAALDSLPPEKVAHLKLAIERVSRYHQRQVQQSWFDDHESEILLGQKVTPLDRVGVYVPGGKASYPSSVLMNVLPAKVAGVDEVIMVSPAPKGYNPSVLAAARMCGVDRVFRIGGAQAVAALAYGTESIPAVDKIVGPGNIYVALAKRQVFGRVGIDMVAGPSEILVVADHSARPAWIAADMLSQAEHDELAVAVLMTPSQELAAAVKEQLKLQLEKLDRREIAGKSLADQGAIIITRSLDEALQLANRFAAEHLELAVADPMAAMTAIRHAGAIFLGHYTPEALGDYLAGPNHVLPTGGTARFSSPLGVHDFIKRSSVLSFTHRSLVAYGRPVQDLARMEGLQAHGRAVGLRMSNLQEETEG